MKQLRKNRLYLFLVMAAKVGVAAYFGVFVLLIFNQRSLIFPGAYHHNVDFDRVTPSSAGHLLKNARGDVLGLFEPALGVDRQPVSDVTSRPTLIYFYGNGSSLKDSRDSIDRFRRDGVNIFIAEYPGFGMNGGEPSEKDCYATADAAYAYLTHDLHIDPSHIVIAGWSLGTAVAVDLASRVTSAGLVVISPFTDMAEQSSHRYPIYPAWLIRLVLRYPFASDAKIGRVACPILDIHSKTDTTVPFFMSARLMSKAKSPVTRVVIERAGHNEFFTVGGDRVYTQMLDFVYASTRLEREPIKRNVVLTRP